MDQGRFTCLVCGHKFEAPYTKWVRCKYCSSDLVTDIGQSMSMGKREAPKDGANVLEFKKKLEH